MSCSGRSARCRRRPGKGARSRGVAIAASSWARRSWKLVAGSWFLEAGGWLLEAGSWWLALAAPVSFQLRVPASCRRKFSQRIIRRLTGGQLERGPDGAAVGEAFAAAGRDRAGHRDRGGKRAKRAATSAGDSQWRRFFTVAAVDLGGRTFVNPFRMTDERCHPERVAWPSRWICWRVASEGSSSRPVHLRRPLRPRLLRLSDSLGAISSKRALARIAASSRSLGASSGARQ